MKKMNARWDFKIIVNFEHVSHHALVFLLLILNM